MSANQSQGDAAAARAGGEDGDALLRRLPKVELHLHMEGALRPATVRELARRNQPDSPLCADSWYPDFFSFTDLTGFAAQFAVVARTAVRSVDDYVRIARECFEDLAAQNVRYAEVSIGPRTPGLPYYVSLPDQLAAIDTARREVESRTPLQAGLILGLSRDHHMPDDAAGAALAQRWVREACDARDRGVPVVGIDLHGDERLFQNLAPFVAAFRDAADAGLGLRAHAGEAAGPESVWDCLRALGVRRIAHGVRSVEDPALIAHLAGEGVVLDVCPVSNVKTGAVASLAAHPIRALHAAGVTLTISSDDPLPFATTITQELLLLHHELGFSLAELGEFSMSAATHSFMPEPAKTALVAAIRSAWSEQLGVAATPGELQRGRH